MIVNQQTKLAEDRIGCNFNWLGDGWIYVDSHTELAHKIWSLSPNFNFVYNESGELIDVTPIE